jgi:acetolactate synthase small subunit
MSKFSLLTTLTLNAAGYTQGINKATKEARQLQRGVAAAGASVKQSFAGIGASFTPILANTNGLSTSIMSGLKAFRLMIPAVNGLKAALVSSGIGAIIVGIGVAIGSMVTYMKRTDEGSNVMKKSMNALDAVVDQTLHKISYLGAALFDLFSGDWESMKKNFKAIFSDFGEEMKGALDNAAKLSDMEIALERFKDTYAKKRAQIEVQISDLKLKAKDENYSIEQRLKYNEQLKGQMLALYNLDAQMKQQELNIARQEMELGEDNHEYRQLVNQAEADLIKLRADYNTQLKETLRTDNNLKEIYQEQLAFEKTRNEILKDNANLQTVDSKEFSQTFTVNADPQPLEQMANEMQKIQAMNFAESQITQWQRFKDTIKDSATHMQLIGTAINGMSDGLMDLAETGQSSFKEAVTSILDGLRQIVNGLLAQAIGSLLANGAAKGLWGLIGAAAGYTYINGVMEK